MSCARLRWCLLCVCLTACDGVGVSGGSWRMLDDAASACCIAPCVPAAPLLACVVAPLLACVGFGVCPGFALHLPLLPCVILAGTRTSVGVYNACGLRARRCVLETAVR